MTTPHDVFLVGATGTIGRATARALRQAGHRVTALIRPRPDAEALLPGITLREGDPTDARSIRQDGLRDDRFDVVLSCLASRTGAPQDAWAVDYRAHMDLLSAAQAAGIRHMILLSALCVQKPRLAFQNAKLAFEIALAEAPLDHTIVRPTAFFKSLSGQVTRVRDGKPYLIFGDGRLTACKPIHDDDLAAYLERCVTEPDLRNRILPIGGPGPALTPRDMGEMLFTLTGQTPRYRAVSPRILTGIAGGLDVLGRVSARMADRAEFARTGHYYATESMLVLDSTTGQPDPRATPSFGTHHLRDHYAALLAGRATDDRGDHAVF
ncbi:MAG: NAD(P)H-binding protein [Salibaculum sp.]|jgi:divinyl chlorophyllide a 8-vinyl-reductase|uniref:NAD(P)H-binding protein n=1 Tax=Roseovarius halophilus (ex Wu et al. 2025) TaxID=3376060 RepID=UPI00286FB828|nr:NAD(P)H-binding protein [Salibaculum sp.]MDR9427855.1 NAD(P)H-binding protein [Salibaculum sp.]MDR9483320.1 NAD(P)H-binding protein [Salibaculum sp.]